MAARNVAHRRIEIADSVIAAIEQKPPTFVVDAGAERPLPGRDSLRFTSYSRALARNYRLIYPDEQYGLRVFRRAGSHP